MIEWNGRGRSRVIQSSKKGFATLIVALPLLTACYLCLVSNTSSQVKPIPPESLQISSVPEGIEIAWKPVSGALHYTVFWGFERGQYKNLYNTPGTRVVLSGLKKGELYYVAVTTWTPAGESNYSHEQAVVDDDDPSRAKSHLTKANELMQKGNYPEAHAYASAAVRLDPTNPEAYKDRGLLYERTSRPDLARQDYATAEKLYKKRPLSLIPRPSTY
jgi:hypothetical protein